MSEPLLPAVEVNPDRSPDAAIVWLHGLGANGHDFEPIVPELGLPEELAVRFVFPHAPAIPVTLNGGFVMPAWYDIVSLDTRGQDEVGIARSGEQVSALIEREIENGLPSERIVLAGFSMGGAIALHLGLRYPKRLAGIMGLSCYLLREASLDDEASEANAGTEVFLGHGSVDPMVPVQLGLAARDRIAARGNPVEFHDYPIPHSVSPEEARDIGAWLTRVLA